MSIHWKRRTGELEADRRRRSDRRSRHVLFSDWRWAYAGRRKGPRRDGDRAGTGVDIYEPGLFALALAIFLLSCLDAGFTLMLIYGGLGFEANPFMRVLLNYDVQTFVNIKMVLTGAGVIFLVVLADATLLNRIQVRRVMYGVLVAYVAIVVYEIVNIGILG